MESGVGSPAPLSFVSVSLTLHEGTVSHRPSNEGKSLTERKFFKMTKNETKKQHILETIENIERKIETLKLQLEVQKNNLAKVESKIQRETSETKV